MKIIDIISTASSNMLRSKVRTFLTVVAIFIGAFTITLTVGISSGISSYIDKQLGNIGAENVLLIQPKVESEFATGPEKYNPEQTGVGEVPGGAGGPGAMLLAGKDIAKIKTQPGISDVQPVQLATPQYITGPNNEKYKLEAQSFVEGSTFDLASGKLPDNRSKQNEVLLPFGYAEPLGFGSNEAAVGKPLTFTMLSPQGRMQPVNAKVSGVLQQSLISASGSAYANTPLLNQLNAIQTQGLPPAASDRYVLVTAQLPPNSTETELQTVKDGLDGKGYTALTVKDQIGIIKQVIDAITYVLIFFAAIALLAASFGIINTLFMSVQERTKEIGLMKAMGMSRFKVFLLFSIEAVLLGFWGSFLGVLAAMGVGRVVNNYAANNFLKDLPGFELTSFPLMAIAPIMLLIMAIAFLAGTLPARRAARQDAIDALRYE